jgi:hypothetical protein
MDEDAEERVKDCAERSVESHSATWAPMNAWSMCRCTSEVGGEGSGRKVEERWAAGGIRRSGGRVLKLE